MAGFRTFSGKGGDGLTFSSLQHEQLKTLIIETGGVPPNAVKQVGEARLPNLEKLEMWLGSNNYGFDSRIEDFAISNLKRRIIFSEVEGQRIFFYNLV